MTCERFGCERDGIEEYRWGWGIVLRVCGVCKDYLAGRRKTA